MITKEQKPRTIMVERERTTVLRELTNASGRGKRGAYWGRDGEAAGERRWPAERHDGSVVGKNGEEAAARVEDDEEKRTRLGEDGAGGEGARHVRSE